jgi:hypothetical protein
MNKLTFKIEFLSDIVLQASSNTQGNIELLDFIPGSNFLGMVAKNYNNFENSFDIFHSGVVRFGDATILDNNEKTYKIPLSYFHEKLDDKKIYNHHYIKDEDFKEFKQLKQKRNGYITKDIKLVELDYNYSQKSAYDKELRRSKDSSMYGYSSIPKGTTWQFYINYGDISQKDLELLKESITGKQRLGKSKSSQYGLVNIEEINYHETLKTFENSNEVILYANSRIVLIDDNGNPTYDLKYICDELKDENILYDKCQLRISQFTPYNGARQTKDYERVCINKGSVIVLKDISSSQLKEISNGVGAYLSEGFGEFIINPEFISKKDGFSITKEDSKDKPQNQRETIEKSFSNQTIQFLVNRNNEEIQNLTIANEVSNFIKNNKSTYSEKMNSQWGTIRSICTNSTNENIKSNVEEYISHGIAKEKWDGNKTTKLLDAIENSQNSLVFTKLLATQMPKEKN